MPTTLLVLAEEPEGITGEEGEDMLDLQINRVREAEEPEEQKFYMVLFVLQLRAEEPVQVERECTIRQELTDLHPQLPIRL